VLGDLPRDAWHVRGTPREDVGVGAEEVDKHHFLFRVEGRTDPPRLGLGGSRVEGHFLGLLRGLEVPACLVVESRSSLTIFSKVVTSASSSASASACSTHSTSQSKACSMDEPTVMTPFGPGI
jgi:hypothetical protein